MANSWVLLQGLLIGFVMAAPLGPIAFLVIKRSLVGHLRIAWIAALGASFADVTLAFAAAYGIRFFFDFLTDHTFWFQLGGGFLVSGIGARMVLKRPKPKGAPWESFAVPTTFFFAFFLTLLNPLTFMTFAAIFSALHFENLQHNTSLLLLLGGILIGALLWWAFLIALSVFTRNRFGIEDVWKVHKGIGLILVILGILLISNSLIQFIC